MSPEAAKMSMSCAGMVLSHCVGGMRKGMRASIMRAAMAVSRRVYWMAPSLLAGVKARKGSIAQSVAMPRAATTTH